jgi:hypothetical protein
MQVRPLVVAAILAATTIHAEPTLDRDLRDYMILAQRSAALKNFAIEAPGCNIGVNCGEGHTNAACGVLNAKNASLGGVSQAVANRLCASDQFGAVFRNEPSGCDPTCDMVTDQGSGPGCTTAWEPPLVGDLDHDGRPSCDAGCVTDPDDLAAACGVALPLPACDKKKTVFVTENHDCSVGDVIPGNRRCDLAAGTYGTVIVRNGAWLQFSAGTTVVCNLKAGKATRVKSAGPAVVIAPDKGAIKLNNDADVGSDCGMLRFVADRGVVHFGRNGDITADVCAIRGLAKLGHANTLRGQFFGDRVLSDFDNDGRCCASRVVVTTTTTTLATTTTTSTTTTSTTTTLGGGTTTTTLGGGTTTTTVASTTTTTLDGGTTTTTVATTTTTTVAGTTTTTLGGGTTTTTLGGGTTTTTLGGGTTTTTVAGTTTTTAASTTTTTVAGTTTTLGGGTTTTSTTVGSTTTTTLQAALFTRTIGFYKTHPAITAQILASAGPLTVCGKPIANVSVGSASSAIEALCVSPRGNQQLQLIRQLTGAALNIAAGGAPWSGFAACNAACADPNASSMTLFDCIDAADSYNQSGDNVAAPWDPPGSASTASCDLAQKSKCTLLDTSGCTTP